MSELRIALLAIALAVLAGLYAIGKWQERRLLRRLSKELGGEVGDALLGEAAPRPSMAPVPARAGPARARIEPRLLDEFARGVAGSEPGPEPQAHVDGEVGDDEPAEAPRRSDWVEDPMLDCVLELRCARPVDGVSFIDAAMPLAAPLWPMPVAFVVWDARAQQWVHPDRFGYYTDALAAIQLANRRHVMTEEQLGRFVAAVRHAASMLDADCDPPDVARVAASASDLDRLCARFDVRIGLNLEAAAGPWTRARVQTAAAQLGLAPAGELRWTEDGADPPGIALSMPSAVSEHASLELDVPRTVGGGGDVQRMFGLAKQLGAVLNARIVDDNGRPIDAQSVAAIEAQLERLLAEMKAAGIEPGGDRARRLYV